MTHVCTLEGGTVTDTLIQKVTLRSAIKAVVHCDIFQPEPVADQGPYDIVTTCLCLEYMALQSWLAFSNQEGPSDAK